VSFSTRKSQQCRTQNGLCDLLRSQPAAITALLEHRHVFVAADGDGSDADDL
jgi:hypothetical protein